MTSSIDFLRAVPQAGEPGAFRFEVPDGWQQGRGAFGGLVLGAMARAASDFLDTPERPARSLTGEIAGPVAAGPARLVATKLREGTGVSVVRVDLEQGGEHLAQAVVVYGKDRAATVTLSSDPPAELAAGFQHVPVVPLETPVAPVFARHFEFRPLPPFPFSSGAPITTGWIRLREPPPAHDAPSVVFHADAWFPSLFTALDGPRPGATLAFSLTFTGAPPSGETPFFHRGRTLAYDGGYYAELRELWSPDGRLIAVNHQTMALIK